MKKKFKLEKRKIGNNILLAYCGFSMTATVLRLPDLSLIEKFVFLMGKLVGFGIPVIITLAYWFIMKTRYLKEGNTVSVGQLFLGFLLVAAAGAMYSINFVQTFIILSIVIILRDGYKVSV